MSGHRGCGVTWFGNPDDPGDRASFVIRQDPRSGIHPDWETEDYETVRHIPGSDDNDIYDSGAGPDVLALTLRFATRADYRAFRARVKTIGTLQLLAGMTGIAGAGWDGATGTERHDMGQDYERYAPVYLRRPRSVRNRIGGAVECEVEFVLGVTLGGS